MQGRAPVEVTAAVVGGGLAVTISDAGPGVADSDRPHLFDRFYMSDSSRQGGSGLGLAIARQHAERLGGTLTARSAEPSGLVFELHIPVTESLLPGDPDETSKPDPDGARPSQQRSEP